MCEWESFYENENKIFWKIHFSLKSLEVKVSCNNPDCQLQCVRESIAML